ncbi:phosphotransacetylase family protein [Natronomonas halophila]|uniref:phosphotransacetylase family protein n=1 Tax=Natronomonas halophila TaxID=2747817 RepID=UPI0015B3D839|nr:phosphotransacetylase family protein [Natronomonas halophila]QLD87194.1 phosphotransacetylase family protein [Natronomonas halophila]
MSCLVTSTEPSAGKTAVALALATAAEERGERVGYMKPKGTRLGSAVDETLDSDPLLAREVLDLDAATSEMEPLVYSPAFLQEVVRGNEAPETLRERVGSAFERLEDEHDRVVVEGSGSPASGASIGLTDADLAEKLDATVILVAHYEEPADIDDILAAADRFGDRLGGVLFNAVPDAAFDDLASDVVPFLEARGVRVYGTIPYQADLAGVSVADLADELGAEALTDVSGTDALVQRFVVGAMTANEALERLSGVRDAALVTGGDRADIQTTVLEASGVRCLLLTGGIRPPDAVLERAESAGVPVLLARTDTKTTLDRAKRVLRSGRTRETATVDRMGELLRDYADVDAMLAPR